MNYYERHLGDYAKDTALLSQGQVGAYDLLLDYYYATEKPLPLDMADLHKITRATTAAERANVAKVLVHFFTKTADGYVKGRVEQEIERYRVKSAKAAASANARWKHEPKPCEEDADAMRTHNERIANADANALPTQCEGNASQSPVTSNQEKNPPTPRKRGDGFDPLSVTLPGWLPDEVWREWVQSRGRKRLSEIAVARQLRDLGDWRAKGHDPVEIIGASIRNGWQGLFEPKGVAPAQQYSMASTMPVMPAGASWK